MKKKALISSILTIALCLSIIAGSTFALFTANKTLDVSVTAGTVDLTAVYDTNSMLTWSLYETEKDARTDGKFNNTGTAVFSGDSVVIDRMTPGDVAKFMIDVENLSNVNVQYRVCMVAEEIIETPGVTYAIPYHNALVVTAYIDGFNYPVTGTENATLWKFVENGQNINDIWVTVSFPNHDEDGSYDNQFKNRKVKITFVVEAVQGNANTMDLAKTFTVAEGENDVIDANGYIAEGIYTAEGATVALEKETLGLKGTVTLDDIKLDATNQSSLGMTFWDVDDGEDVTLVLEEGATIIAAEGDLAIRSSMITADESFTLIMDEGSKIVVSGADAAALLVQGWEPSVVNVVLNGKAADLFELNNGAHGMGFSGNDGTELLVNIFVRNADEMAEYMQIVDAYSAMINWFVDGTYVQTVNF